MRKERRELWQQREPSATSCRVGGGLAEPTLQEAVVRAKPLPTLLVTFLFLCVIFVPLWFCRKGKHRKDTKFTQRGTKEEKDGWLLRRSLRARDQPCQEIDSIPAQTSRVRQAAEVARLLAQFIHARTRELSVLPGQIFLCDRQCLGFAIQLQEQVHIHLGREGASLRGREIDLVAEMLEPSYGVVTVEHIEKYLVVRIGLVEWRIGGELEGVAELLTVSAQLAGLFALGARIEFQAELNNRRKVRRVDVICPFLE